MMKSVPAALAAALAAAGIWLAGCTTAPDVKKVVALNFQTGVPGGTYLETYQATVQIVAVDPATREITFEAADGSRNTFRAGPKFAAFGNCRAGQSVKVSIARELAMYLGHEIPASTNTPAAVLRREPDAQPGVLQAETVDTTAIVAAVDPPRREVTLQLAGGRDVTFKVRADADLGKVALGSPVAIRTASALVLLSAP